MSLLSKYAFVCGLLATLSCPLVAANCPLNFPHTKIFFVNGIENSEEDARAAADAIDKAVRDRLDEIGSTIPRGCLEPTGYSYNKDEAGFLDLIEAADQLLLGQMSRFWQFLAGIDAAPDSLQQFAADFFRALDADRYIRDSDLTNFVNTYSDAIQKSNNKVILVAHSQGNFYANEAFRILPTVAGPLPPGRIDIVAVATPASGVEGDGPWLTRTLDIILGFPLALPANAPYELCGTPLQCHKFLESYLTKPVTRLRVLDHVIALVPIPNLQIVVSPNSYDFGNVQVGSSSQATLTITNPGNATLTVSGVNMTPGDFTLNASSFPTPPFNIDPGAVQTFGVVFAPAADGVAEGTITIVSNVPTSPTSVMVRGTGIAASQETSTIRLTNDAGSDTHPAWSPDGQRIGFISSRGKQTPSGGDIWTIDPSGVNSQQMTLVPDVSGTLGAGLTNLAWLGNSGDVVTLETIVFWEYFRLQLSANPQLPIIRSNFDGGSPSFNPFLFIPGGLGSSHIAVSHDGAQVAWEILTVPFFACPRHYQVRVAPTASLMGQAATAVGTVVAMGSVPCGAPTGERFQGLSFSPDGTQLVISRNQDTNFAGYDLEIYKTDGTFVRRLTNNGVGQSAVKNWNPSWSSDNRIAFASDSTGQFEVYVIDADGLNPTQITFNGGDWPSWSPDSAKIAFQSTRDGNEEIYVIDTPVKAPSMLSFVRSEFSVAFPPFALSHGDFNRDGHTDLVVLHHPDHSRLTIFLNDGTGSFRVGEEYTTAPLPVFVAVEDLNSDGFSDVLTVNNDTAAVSIFLGSGDGALQPRVDVQLTSQGIFRHNVAVGDINNDGSPDLIVPNFANLSGGTVVASLSVLFGNGNGTFSHAYDLQRPTTTFGGVGSDVVLADFNHDGELDLLGQGVDLILGHVLSVWLGNGDGTFGARHDSSASQGFRAVTGDFNSDGFLDILTLEGISSILGVHLGLGTGEFRLLNVFGSLGGNVAISIKDFNNDGRLDIALPSYAGVVAVHLGLGDGTFAPGQFFVTTMQPSGLAAADFDNDGRIDIAITENIPGSLPVPGRISIFRNTTQ